ncbi:MAG: hypothetical protein OEW77_08590 [Gemmatimonadota bacterium]|nr:hypothetical protein [Gemmatimonadota bacterium]
MTDDVPETVGSISELYLGNILYALERCALAMAEEGKSADAQFYRGIGRLLAEAHGKHRKPVEG